MEFVTTYLPYPTTRPSIQGYGQQFKDYIKTIHSHTPNVPTKIEGSLILD